MKLERWISFFSLLLIFVFSPAIAHSSENCSIHADYDPRATAPITVDFELTCNGSMPRRMTWSLGDGTVINGNPISHTFLENGAFEVGVEFSTRVAVAERTIHIPEFFLLDDFEDEASSRHYWGLPTGSPAATRFAWSLRVRDEGGNPNTEFRVMVWGGGDGEGGGNFGNDGLQLPPLSGSTGGSGGGNSGGGTAGFAEWPSHPEGQIVFDLRFEMEWQKMLEANTSIRFTALELPGMGARLMARATLDEEVFLRLETEANSTPWVSLGPGDLDTRVAVKLAPAHRSKRLALEWRQQGQSSVEAVSMQVPGDSQLNGFNILTPWATIENGNIPTLFELGFLYIDNFELSDYAEGVGLSTF